MGFFNLLNIFQENEQPIDPLIRDNKTLVEFSLDFNVLVTRQFVSYTHTFYKHSVIFVILFGTFFVLLINKLDFVKEKISNRCFNRGGSVLV